jgi:N-acetylneuraminic acid mutarotase
MAGDLIQPRYAHTATLLPNGKVMIYGGYTSDRPDQLSALRSSEVFDPVTRTWGLPTSAFYARVGHQATLLTTGRVLVTGGVLNARAEEIYNPATNSWFSTTRMLEERLFHTATRLQNGKVLVAGGFNHAFTEQFGWLSTAEIYDPVTHTWTPTGKMSTGRFSHVANLLPDGRVLVVGGFVTTGDSTSAELFDPATGTWSPASGTFYPRVGGMHRGTTLRDGSVVITGGYVNDTLGPSIPDVEIFSPKTLGFYSVGDLNEPRRYHGATLLSNGKVLVAGGHHRTQKVPGGFTLTSTETYDPATFVWTGLGHMNVARVAHTLTALSDGRVLAAGGTNQTDAQLSQRTSELFIPGFGVTPRRLESITVPILGTRSLQRSTR